MNMLDRLKPPDQQPSPVSSLADLASSISTIITDLSSFLRPSVPTGLFEILDYDTELELVDRQGSRAELKKRLKVRFLQDNVIAFQDYAWGDGGVLYNYRCSPGVIVDRYREGGRWNVLISLRETKSRGDIVEFFIERRLRHSFEAKEAWWQVSMQHETQRLRISVLYPKSRHCLRAVLSERNRNRVTPLSGTQLASLPDGGQMLTYENEKVSRFETYTIKWSW